MDGLDDMRVEVMRARQERRRAHAQRRVLEVVLVAAVLGVGAFVAVWGSR